MDEPDSASGATQDLCPVSTKLSEQHTPSAGPSIWRAVCVERRTHSSERRAILKRDVPCLPYRRRRLGSSGRSQEPCQCQSAGVPKFEGYDITPVVDRSSLLPWEREPPAAGGTRFSRAGWIHPPEAGESCFYVYDCGAMNRYAKARDREIEELIARLGKGARLVFLVVPLALSQGVHRGSRVRDVEVQPEKHRTCSTGRRRFPGKRLAG